LDGIQFDDLTRGLAGVVSRRRALSGLGAGFALASLLTGGAAAQTRWHGYKKGKKGKKGKKAKKRNKPLVLNQFGCVNIGGQCRGEGANCCSGICQGNKPKPGENDKSTCVGHNAGACTPQNDACILDFPESARCNPAIEQAFCFVTTGGGSFCGNTSGASAEGNCRLCAKDKDCEALGFPPGSACIPFNAGACTGDCAGRGDLACLPPGI
jgi:hypothetical protein